MSNWHYICTCCGAAPGRGDDPHRRPREQERDLAQAATLRFKVYRLTPQQKAQWIAATRVTHPELIRAIGGESARLYAGIEQARRKWAARPAAAAAQR